MTRPFESFELALPDGWSSVDPGNTGALLRAEEVGAEGFRSSLVADLYYRDGADGDLGWLQAFHHDQVLGMSQALTDTLVIDDAQVDVGGRPAWMTTIAFRQGWWTVTGRIWSIQAPDSVAAVVFLCDSERFASENPLFEAMVAGIEFEPTSDV